MFSRLKYWELEDYVGAFFATVAGLVILAVVVLFLGLIVDSAFDTAARQARFACETRNLTPVRQDFSTQVACVSRNTGADTLNVKTLQ